jgi:hypothetical protein
LIAWAREQLSSLAGLDFSEPAVVLMAISQFSSPDPFPKSAATKVADLGEPPKDRLTRFKWRY